MADASEDTNDMLVKHLAEVFEERAAEGICDAASGRCSNPAEAMRRATCDAAVSLALADVYSSAYSLRGIRHDTFSDAPSAIDAAFPFEVVVECTMAGFPPIEPTRWLPIRRRIEEMATAVGLDPDGQPMREAIKRAMAVARVELLNKALPTIMGKDDKRRARLTTIKALAHLTKQPQSGDE